MIWLDWVVLGVGVLGVAIVVSWVRFRRSRR